MKSGNVKLLAVIGLVSVGASVASAASILDLTAAGSSGQIQVSAGGPSAIFSTTVQQPTGTGVIQPFVRIQGNGTEKGYNTDGPIEFDTKDTNNWTRSITLADVAVVTINSVKYREFFLDINEAGNTANMLLSMDKLQVFLGNAPDLTSYPGFGGNAFKIYDMDTGPTGDRYVQMDYRNANGSGSGDLNVYIPDSLFAGPAAYKYIYLFSSFGTPSSSNAGFEEWSSRTGTSTPPPPPAAPTPAALGGGLVGMGMLLASRRGRGK